MTMSDLKVFCVIPAWNEERNISKVVASVKPLVDAVIVVDDGSSDDTYNLASAHDIIVLRHATNRGQGAGLQTGNEYALLAGADVIVHFDADGQFLAEEIGDLIEPIKRGEADVVFGSRFMEKKSEIPFFKKNIIMPLAKIFNNILGIKGMTDPQSGFRALSRRVAEKIKIEHDDMAHCSEILMKVFENNFKVKEVPTTVIYEEFGQRLGGGIKIIKSIFIKKIIS